MPLPAAFATNCANYNPGSEPISERKNVWEDITYYSDGQFGCHAALGESKKLVKLPGARHYQSCYFCNPEMHEIGMAEAAARFKQYL